MLTSAEVTDLVAGVEIIANDQGNRVTLSLSPARTPVEFGLAGISCFPRVSWTVQWTSIIALMTFLQ